MNDNIKLPNSKVVATLLELPTAEVVLVSGDTIDLEHKRNDDEMKHLFIECCKQLYTENENLVPLQDTTEWHERANNVIAFSIKNCEPALMIFAVLAMLRIYNLPLILKKSESFSIFHDIVGESIADWPLDKADSDILTDIERIIAEQS